MFKDIINLLRELPKNKDWVITVERIKRQRSNLQNSALWGCAYAVITAETGNEPDDLHTMFCGEYFGWVDYKVLGKLKRKPRRTTTKNHSGEADVITTVDLANFYLFIQARSSEYGVIVPDPDPDWFKK